MTKPNPKDYPNMKEWAEVFSKFVSNELNIRLTKINESHMDSITKLQEELLQELGFKKSFPIKKKDNHHAFLFSLEELDTMYTEGIK